ENAARLLDRERSYADQRRLRSRSATLGSIGQPRSGSPRSIRSVSRCARKLDSGSRARQGRPMSLPGGAPPATPASSSAQARVTPCLRVFADTLFVDDGGAGEVQTAMLRLDFAYGGRRVRGGELAGRDRAAELQACRVLESLGAIEVGELVDCAVAPGGGVDY